MSKVYFYSYSTKSSSGDIDYHNEVTDQHPTEIIKKWHDKFNGNSTSRMLFWTEVPRTEYINFCLDKNMGEMWGSK